MKKQVNPNDFNAINQEREWQYKELKISHRE